MQAREGRHAVLLDAGGHFGRGLGEVRDDRQVELARVHHDALPRRVAHRVRRVRRHREGEARQVLPGVADREAELQVAVGVGCVRCREVEHDEAEHRPDSGLDAGAGGGVGMEVHVVEAGRAALEHLGGGEAHAVVDELRRDVTALPWPDLALQPHLERDVVGHTAEEGHRGVRVGVDEAGHQRVAGQLDARARRVVAIGHGGRDERDDRAVVDDQCMARQRAGRLDRDDPVRIEAQVDGSHR
jgi:hypothetical protein